jgi:hypothetical protein
MWNITDSSVENFSIRQSQFWSLNIMNGTNLAFQNITCEGGNGIAIGSLGQYLEDSSVEDIVINDAKVGETPEKIS